MRLPRSRTAITLAGVVLASATLGVGIGYAVSTTVTDEPARIRIVQSEFLDGFVADWHTHPGPVIVQVQEGYFKIWQGSCTPTIVQKGETYVEIPLVPVRAVANGHIKWTTSMIIPVGSSPATPAASPCD